MNEVIRSLMARKSVRVFTDQPVGAEEKRAILEAAMAAPTAGNQQMYTILDITDPALRQRLSVSCDNQPFIASAPLVLVFCADFQKWYDAFIEGGCAPRKPGVGDLMLAVTDTAIAAQNAVTAAESLGIGSCYIGDIMENCEIHREMLNLPDYVFPAVMAVFGYPTRQQQERPKPERCRLEDIVCENGYRRKDGDGLRAMFAGKHPNAAFEDWASRFCNRKYNSDFSREMSRSVGEYLKKFDGPVLRWRESDDDTAPVISPKAQAARKAEPGLALPETALVFWMGHGLDYLAQKEPERWEVVRFPSFLNGGAPIYVDRERGVCMLHGGYGAPQAADTVETLAELGVKRIVGAGMIGGYGAHTEPGDVVIPDRAYVEEGATPHYYPQIDFAQADPELVEKAKTRFPEAKVQPIVTTSAVYRQTFRKEAQWREKGCVGVDMECSAMFGVGAYRGIRSVMVMTVSDRHPLSPDEERSWSWSMTREDRERLADRCLELAMDIR